MALIYIVEDEESIREIETFALKNVGFEIVGYDCAKAFYGGLKNALPQLILLDIMLPDEDGLTIIRKLRERDETRRIPVIMATARTTELDKVKGLDLGADDYITKPFGVMELISRVKALMRRSYYLEEEHMLRNGPVFMDIDKHVIYVNDELCDLTFKEYELLKVLMQRKGTAVPREEIILQVWGTGFMGESRTLDMHIKTLRQKLGEAGSLIKTIRNVGYMMEG